MTSKMTGATAEAPYLAFAGLVAETGVALLYGRLVTRGERRDSGAGPLAFATKRGVAMRDAAIG